MKGRSHENDVFTPCGRSVHTGEKNGWTDGTARFHVHTHQGSQILHSFSWRFRKYKFHVTVMVAVTSFEVWVRIMGFREATTLKGLSENVPGFDNSATSQPTSAHMDAILAHTARLSISINHMKRTSDIYGRVTCASMSTSSQRAASMRLYTLVLMLCPHFSRRAAASSARGGGAY